MACRIESGVKRKLPDPAGKAVEKRIKNELGMGGISSVRVIDAYTFETDLGEEVLQNAGSQLFSDPITQDFSANRPLCPPSQFDYAISVGYKPGVKDNVGETAKAALEDLLKEKIVGNSYSSRHFLIKGKLSLDDAKIIAKELLANELIQRYEIKPANEFGDGGFGNIIPKMECGESGKVEEISLSVPDKKLIEISKDRLLSLSLEEMKRVRDYFSDPKIAEERKAQGLGAMPTDVELESLAQTWSEHCKHKIFNAKIEMKKGSSKKAINSLFATYIKKTTEILSKRKKWLVSVFSDNAGIIEFVPGWNIAMKVETHNSPSALDPYGGALTGILGVNRDVLGCGLGAKPIFNTDVFCFADPHYAGEIPPRLFHPRRVLEGVRAGVAAGGNASGIPTVNGSLVFDKRYLGKPLVYCGTCGIMPSEINGRMTHQKSAAAHDRIFMVGGRIGKDGIHGATFSSAELNESSPVSAVQLGDPYTQKKLLDFLLEARDRGLFNAVTDNGAGGLSSSVGEMAESAGGCVLYLDRALLKYAGLNPWEILLSESQERMTFAVPPAMAQEFLSLARKRDVEVSDLGEFTSSGFFHVKYGAKAVAHIGMDFFHHGLPQMQLQAELRDRMHAEPPQESMKSENLGADLLTLLSRPNICSKEYIIRQYDHEVQGGSVIKPLCGKMADGPSDAGVVAPLLDRKEGIVISNGIRPSFVDIDAYQMAANSVDEAVRNYVSAGGTLDHIAALDNFCWCDPIHTQDNPEGKHRLAQLVEACGGLHDTCIAYGMPLISGKDSMKNDYKFGKWKISIPPTLLVTAIGKINDISRAMTTDFKSEGDIVYLLGETKDELGGSEYYAMKDKIGANVPKVNAKKNFVLYQKLESAIGKGVVASCHDCSEGGLAVAISECCIGGNIGAKIELGEHAQHLSPEQALFSESAGRFIVSVKKKNEPAFRRIIGGTKNCRIGQVGKPKGAIEIMLGKTALLSVPVSEASSAWKKTMDW